MSRGKVSVEMGEGGDGTWVSGNTSPIPGVLSSPLISAIPNQVKAAHAAWEGGNSGQNGNVSVPLSCVAFLRLIRSKYLTPERKRPHQSKQSVGVVHLRSLFLFPPLFLTPPPLIWHTDDKKHRGVSFFLLWLPFFFSNIRPHHYWQMSCSRTRLSTANDLWVTALRFCLCLSTETLQWVLKPPNQPDSKSKILIRQLVCLFNAESKNGCNKSLDVTLPSPTAGALLFLSGSHFSFLFNCKISVLKNLNGGTLKVLRIACGGNKLKNKKHLQ